MKEIAESYLGQVTHAMVPAYLGSKTGATKDAGTIAGLNVLMWSMSFHSLHSHTAWIRRWQRSVHDLGGAVVPSMCPPIDRRRCSRFCNCRHNSFRRRRLRPASSLIWPRNNKKNNVDITKDLKTMGKLKREVEKAKRTLSSQMSTHDWRSTRAKI